MIAFKARATAQNFNDAFLSKLVDDIKIGKLTLSKFVGDPDTVNDVQTAISKSTKVFIDRFDLVGVEKITLNAISDNQRVRVKGDVAAVNLDPTPFGEVATPPDGAEITVIGYDDVFTVNVQLFDGDYGCYINDDAKLKAGYIIVLIWDLGLLRYLEKSRNF